MQHHVSICKEKIFYRCIGTPLMDKVTLKDGSVVTMQQAICVIPSSTVEQLFT